MHFTQVTLLFIAATGALATPLGQDIHARNPGLTQIGSENTADGGSMEFWGRDIEARDPALTQFGSEDTTDGGSMEFWGKRDIESQLVRRTKCKSDPIIPHCDNKENLAENALCDSLIGNLAAYGSQRIDKGWRQVCYKGQTGKCCTAWSGGIDNLQYSDLVKNAQTMVQSCSNNGVSAKMSGVRIRGACVNHCLNSGHSCGG